MTSQGSLLAPWVGGGRAYPALYGGAEGVLTHNVTSSRYRLVLYKLMDLSVTQQAPPPPWGDPASTLANGSSSTSFSAPTQHTLTTLNKQWEQVQLESLFCHALAV